MRFRSSVQGKPRLPHILTSALLAGLVGLTCAAAADTSTATASTANTASDTAAGTAMADIVPAPVETKSVPAQTYTISRDTKIYTEPGSPGAHRVGTYLAGLMRPSTGYELPVAKANGSGAPRGILLLLSGARERVGAEGYRLQVGNNAIVIRANKPAGLFAAVQTLRQLLPTKVERDSVQPGPWKVPGGLVMDYPRFDHRGAMLDVARHFFTVDEVKSYIDQLAMYKINRLHLHLTDDQGWRIQIDSWPRLTTYGGSTEVGGGPGGYYTKEEYKEIVDYAADRFITVIPEIDMPGHTNAALASYDKLNCDGTAPDLYTGTQVGFSSLCVDKEITYEFVDDVIREVAAMTPGPYIHIGGDEAHSTSEEDYRQFMNRAQQIVLDHGKGILGWHQITAAEPVTPRAAQYWGTTTEAPDVVEAAEQGTKVVLSPASHAYIDMKYHEGIELGNDWAGYTPVRDAYEWQPGSYIEGLEESSILGVEAPLWSETIDSSDDIEFLAFPRLPAIAELAWSPASTHDWGSFKQRLAAQAPRWEVLDINYYRSEQVPWP